MFLLDVGVCSKNYSRTKGCHHGLLQGEPKEWDAELHFAIPCFFPFALVVPAYDWLGAASSRSMLDHILELAVYHRIVPVIRSFAIRSLSKNIFSSFSGNGAGGIGVSAEFAEGRTDAGPCK